MERSVKDEFSQYLPMEVGEIKNPRTDIPRMAKDYRITSSIEHAVSRIPTKHSIYCGDARQMQEIVSESVHLVLTSPPYWTLKEYRNTPGQMGNIRDYEKFLEELDKVWKKCFDVLVPGGRLICVVGDVCLSRRKNSGRHTVIPLHASIQEHCRKIGFDNLAPIIWLKIANANYEANGNGAGFLGKPYEPNAVIKNDIEYILMERKPGGYRNPSISVRILSLIPAEKHSKWFRQIWSDITGESTKQHPAPFPLELAERLICMFSFVGDTVLDPFMGTGTTNLAAAIHGRNSIGYEIDPHYYKIAVNRLRRETLNLFSNVTVIEQPSKSKRNEI